LPQSLAVHVPALQQQVNDLMAQKSTSQNNIAHHLHTLLPITARGIGNKLYVQFYWIIIKPLTPRLLIFYWREYDKEEE
jgi:hypothetical protein